jgi:hypothetical protein
MSIVSDSKPPALRVTPPQPEVRGLLLDASGTLLRSSRSAALGVDFFPDALSILGACRRRSLGGIPIRTALVTNWGHGVVRLLEPWSSRLFRCSGVR